MSYHKVIEGMSSKLNYNCWDAFHDSLKCILQGQIQDRALLWIISSNKVQQMSGREREGEEEKEKIRTRET